MLGVVLEREPKRPHDREEELPDLRDDPNDLAAPTFAVQHTITIYVAVCLIVEILRIARVAISCERNYQPARPANRETNGIAECNRFHDYVFPR